MKTFLYLKNKTVLVVAHRLSTVRNAGKIVIVNQGETAEIGSILSLFTYSFLYNAQLS
ncbi:MAG: hypothetical protein J6P84_06110 [Alphaproteobacteria bacterium]|nr:hypothetical protein [Alphaproteobacteria bacterium]